MPCAVSLSRFRLIQFGLRLCCGAGLVLAAALSFTPCRAQSWSPNGRQIAVGGPSLTLVEAQTAGANVPISTSGKPSPTAALTSSAMPTALLPNTAAAFAPVWSPDSKTVAYLADGQTLTFYDTAKQNPKSLNDATVAPVAWSLDSALFASVHKTESGGLQALIRYRSGATFLPPIDLPFSTVPGGFAPLGWIANTTNVVVAGGMPDKYDLYLLDQGTVVRLTSTSDVIGFIVSPDGSSVRWIRRSPNTRYILLSVYEMTLDTRSTRKLPFPDVVKAVNPDPRHYPDAVISVVFAPDMSRFAFVTRGGPQAGKNGSALWISDIAGQNVQFVGKGGGANSVQTSPAPASATQQTGVSFPAFLPAFSPDSKYLAALRSENGMRSLFVADAATGQGKTTPLP